MFLFRHRSSYFCPTIWILSRDTVPVKGSLILKLEANSLWKEQKIFFMKHNVHLCGSKGLVKSSVSSKNFVDLCIFFMCTRVKNIYLLFHMVFILSGKESQQLGKIPPMDHGFGSTSPTISRPCNQLLSVFRWFGYRRAKHQSSHTAVLLAKYGIATYMLRV